MIYRLKPQARRFKILALLALSVASIIATVTTATIALADASYIPPNGAQDVQIENLVFTWPSQAVGYYPQQSLPSGVPGDSGGVLYYPEHTGTSSITSDDPGSDNDPEQFGSIYYRFMLASDPEIHDVILDANVYGTAYMLKDKLKYGHSYFWRVMSLEPAPGDWSTLNFFCTAAEPKPAVAYKNETPVPAWALVTIVVGSGLILTALVLTIITRRPRI